MTKTGSVGLKPNQKEAKRSYTSVIRTSWGRWHSHMGCGGKFDLCNNAIKMELSMYDNEISNPIPEIKAPLDILFENVGVNY